MSKTVAILATLDTKGKEAEFVRDQLALLGSPAKVLDLGVLGEPAFAADVSRDVIARAGGKSIEELLREPTRETSTPVMAAGAIRTLQAWIERDEVHAVLGFGGLQGTALCSEIMRALPYGFPKIMVSTVASGDTSAYVDIKDITMMFSVGDILGLNPFTRKILAKAAGAAHGMAQVEVAVDAKVDGRPTIGMTNLGVLTEGAIRAIERFESKGYEVITFHAVGSGGRAMEQMMREGIIGAVFDYALGEIADGMHGALRAGGPERLTVAGDLGLPQVICPGGAEHLGVLVDPPNTVPEAYRDHTYVFHSPVVFVPRLRADEFAAVGKEITDRLAHTKGRAVFMIPTAGTSRYGKVGGPLRDVESDQAFFAALRSGMPTAIEIVERDAHAEDPTFVDECVDRLIALIEES